MSCSSSSSSLLNENIDHAYRFCARCCIELGLPALVDCCKSKLLKLCDALYGSSWELHNVIFCKEREICGVVMDVGDWYCDGVSYEVCGLSLLVLVGAYEVYESCRDASVGSCVCDMWAGNEGEANTGWRSLCALADAARDGDRSFIWYYSLQYPPPGASFCGGSNKHGWAKCCSYDAAPHHTASSTSSSSSFSFK